jgi:organic radical activating enzyme
VSEIFWSIQGESHLRGFQMAFLRLGGCSVGCPECDTAYAAKSTHDARELSFRVGDMIPSSAKDKWVWITGGEPQDHDLVPLIRELRARGLSVAVATAGHKRFTPTVDWLSVSPHKAESFVQRYGHEIKLVDGLHGLDLFEFVAEHKDGYTDFWYRYVQPLSIDGVEDPASLKRCMEFLERHPNWALSRQDQHVVGFR